jgi:hypothetical protein
LIINITFSKSKRLFPNKLKRNHVFFLLECSEDGEDIIITPILLPVQKASQNAKILNFGLIRK